MKSKFEWTAWRVQLSVSRSHTSRIRLLSIPLRFFAATAKFKSPSILRPRFSRANFARARARARGSSETPRHFALHCLTCALTIRAPGINLIFYFGNERSVSYDGGLLESACARLTLSFRRAFLMNLRELSSFSFPPSVCSFSPLHVSCSSCSGEHAYSLRSAETSSSLRDSPSFDP